MARKINTIAHRDDKPSKYNAAYQNHIERVGYGDIQYLQGAVFTEYGIAWVYSQTDIHPQRLYAPPPLR